MSSRVAQVQTDVLTYCGYIGTYAGNPGELCTNQTFESGTTGWSKAGTPTIAQSSAAKHSGTYSLLCTFGGTGDISSNYVAHTGLTLAEYRVSFWARTASGDATLHYGNQAEEYGTFSLTTTWTRYSDIISSATSLRLFTASASTFYIDDVSIVLSGSEWQSDPVTTFSTYQNIDAISGKLPAVSVLLGPERMVNEDTARQVFSSEVDVLILGYCRVADQEALLQDVKRICAVLSKQYATSSTDRWVMGKLSEIKFSRDFRRDSPLAWVGAQFKAMVLHATDPF